MAENVVPQLSENISDLVNNATTKVPATTEGMFMAYFSLLTMALVPIYIGSFRSVTFLKDRKDKGEMDRISTKDAAMYPLIASGVLLSIYIIFKIFSKEYLNFLIACYFFLLGILAVTHLLSPLMSKILPAAFPNEEYKFLLLKKAADKFEDLINFQFDRRMLVALALSTVLGVWYILKKHWIANNLFGLAFSINAVEIISLNSVKNGCILLGGLFIYDIFWVFGTDVMVFVAKSFDAPIKLIFPQDLFESGLSANNFAMLGLGDIVVPGIFIALMLRFDRSQNKSGNFYFNACFIAYFLGLVGTIVVLHVFKHAQPALLYLVPTCLGVPLFFALVKGDLGALLKYEDVPEVPEKKPDDSTISEGEESPSKKDK